MTLTEKNVMMEIEFMALALLRKYGLIDTQVVWGVADDTALAEAHFVIYDESKMFSAIRLNEAIWQVKNVKEIVLHQIAHLLAYLKHGQNIEEHGPEWREIAEGMGIFHSGDFVSFPHRSQCSECSFQVGVNEDTRERLDRIWLKSGQELHCPSCDIPMVNSWVRIDVSDLEEMEEIQRTQDDASYRAQ